MKRNSKKNNYIDTIVTAMADSMTDDEYRKAKEFYEFLVNITKCTHGFLSIDRKKLINITSAYMECSPIEAHAILQKMRNYGWIKLLENDFVVVNLEGKK